MQGAAKRVTTIDVGKMSMIGKHTTLEVRRVWAEAQHVDIMVRFDDDDVRGSQRIDQLGIYATKIGERRDYRLSHPQAGAERFR